jgi:uncharacterized membrane protein
MKKLTKSTWLLIGLLIALTALGTVLIVTVPEDFSFRFHRFERINNEAALNNDTYMENQEYYHFNRAKTHGPKIIFILVIAGAVLIFAGIRKRTILSSQYFKRDVSLDILEEQYAEGKISKEELIRKRKTMKD